MLGRMQSGGVGVTAHAVPRGVARGDVHGGRMRYGSGRAEAAGSGSPVGKLAVH